MDNRRYRVCQMCGEIMPLHDVFAFADERMLVCRICTTADMWSALAEAVDDHGEDARS